MESEPTPSIERILSEGFLAPVRVEDRTPDVSAPCWATIVTGPRWTGTARGRTTSRATGSPNTRIS
ncbi:hypothetical protein [Catenulispora subtropica]|uniref:hypothetical protein n=1 Tax=Catenulispora subtropica TaxID=450798 RepID=UPI0031D2EBF1